MTSGFGICEWNICFKSICKICLIDSLTWGKLVVQCTIHADHIPTLDHLCVYLIHILHFACLFTQIMSIKLIMENRISIFYWTSKNRTCMFLDLVLFTILKIDIYCQLS